MVFMLSALFLRSSSGGTSLLVFIGVLGSACAEDFVHTSATVTFQVQCNVGKTNFFKFAE